MQYQYTHLYIVNTSRVYFESCISLEIVFSVVDDI